MTKAESDNFLRMLKNFMLENKGWILCKCGEYNAPDASKCKCGAELSEGSKIKPIEGVQ